MGELVGRLDSATVGVVAFAIEEVDNVEDEESTSAKSVPVSAEELHGHTSIQHALTELNQTIVYINGPGL